MCKPRYSGPMPTAKPNIVRRWQRLEHDRRRVLVRAAMILAAASAGVALLPFRRAITFGSADPYRSRGPLTPDECVWAVETAARYLPLRTKCIEKGLAVQRLLRQSGAAALLHYGARHNPQTGKLEAHVWVSLNGAILIGGEEAPRFAQVAVYG